MARRGGRDRRGEILEAVGELFLREGYAGTSMSRVAAAAGGSKGTLYAHFDGKEDLFREFIRMRVRRESEALFVFPDEGVPVRDALAAFGRGFLDMALREDTLALFRLICHEATRFPELGRSYRDQCVLDGRRKLSAWLARAGERGALRVEAPDLCAEHFLALDTAGIRLDALFRARESLSPEERDRAVRSAVSVFLAAYGPGADGTGR